MLFFTFRHEERDLKTNWYLSLIQKLWNLPSRPTGKNHDAYAQQENENIIEEIGKLNDSEIEENE